MPASTSAAMRRSRWYWSSSSSSRSTRPLRKSERNRRRSLLSQRTTASLHRLHDQRDGGGETFPLCRLRFQGPAAGRRELVILGAPVVLTHGPFRLDPALLLELVKGGVQRALPDPELFVRHLPDPLGDGPPVHRLERDDAKD